MRCDVAGREVGPKLDDDVAAARKVEGQAVGIGHGYSGCKVRVERAI